MLTAKARLAVGAPGLRVWAAVVLAASAGCATSRHPNPGAPAAPVRVVTTTVTLHGTAMDLHLASPGAPASPTIVIYASGDGGWFGTAVDMFRGIARQGYRTAGFSARAFLRLERPAHAVLNARQLAVDYGAILTRARAAFGAPADTPVILSGWSRGAAFATLAAAEPALRAQTKGVVAIGLAADEDLQVDDDDTDDGPAGDAAGAADAATAPPHPWQTYEQARHLAPLRYVVIQADRDDYLPAAQARVLFGPDTADRRFYDVAARNHRFSGGHAAFLAALTSALSWVDGPAPPVH